MIIGIDPGASGGIALLDATGAAAWAWKMPESRADMLDLARSLAGMIAPAPIVAYIERVAPFPMRRKGKPGADGQPGEDVQVMSSAKTMFTFGASVERAWMAFSAAGARVEEVTPQTWQRALGCLSRGDKKTTRAKAQELFPLLACMSDANVKRVTHAVADALLIAEYGRRARAGAPVVAEPLLNEATA